jgi:hypothetical protein
LSLGIPICQLQPLTPIHELKEQVVGKGRERFINALGVHTGALGLNRGRIGDESHIQLNLPGQSVIKDGALLLIISRFVGGVR